MAANNDEKKAVKNNNGGWAEFWSFMGSAKMAVFLIVILAVFSAFGTFIEIGRPAEEYIKQYGKGTGRLITALGIDHLYQTWWYILLLLLVGLNLVISSIKRYNNLKFQDASLKVNLGPNAFEKNVNAKSLKSSKNAEETKGIVEGILSMMRYKILSEETPKKEIFIYSEKGRIKRWGSFYSHIGILIIFIGAIYGNLPNVGMKDFQLLESGKSYNVKNKDFSIRVNSCWGSADNMGRPTDYVSNISVIDNGKEVKRQDIRVNQPLEYKGVKFYQASFGVYGFEIAVNSPDGNKKTYRFELDQENRPIPGESDLKLPGSNSLTLDAAGFFPQISKMGDQPISLSDLPQDPAAYIFLYTPKKTGDEDVRYKGLIYYQKPLNFEKYDITLSKILTYSGIDIRKDPGYPVVGIGFIVMLAGLAIAFYLSHRFLRVYIRNNDEGGVNLYFLPMPGEEYPFEREFNEIKKAILKA